jgi:hypothetical protein
VITPKRKKNKENTAHFNADNSIEDEPHRKKSSVDMSHFVSKESTTLL